MERWYVVQAKPHLEETAIRHLERQGMASYLPRFRRETRHARKVRTVLRPLFPGYLFVRLDPAAARWQAINSTIGVQRLLCQNGQPQAIDESVIASIQARQGEDGLVAMDSSPPFREGDPLTISQGPLRDIVGLCAGLDDNRRVAVLLQVLGRQVRVSLPLEWVAA